MEAVKSKVRLGHLLAVLLRALVYRPYWTTSPFLYWHSKQYDELVMETPGPALSSPHMRTHLTLDFSNLHTKDDSVWLFTIFSELHTCYHTLISCVYFLITNTNWKFFQFGISSFTFYPGYQYEQKWVKMCV